MIDLTPIEFVRKIEHTLLEPQLSRQDVEAGCAVAVRYDCYAVVVKPHYIELARKLLKDTHVKVIAVVGFPHGGSSTAAKMYETQDVVQRGAEEIEMVVNLGALRDHDDLVVRNDIATVIKVARGHPVTVILETGLLSDEEKERGCKIAETTGASFVKTSSDFAPVATTLDDVRLLRATSPLLQVKAAGGITTREIALGMLSAGAVRIATRATEEIVSG
jgi:deoxyribose-phosphate aldolase